MSNLCSDEPIRTGMSPCDPRGLHRDLSAVLNRHGIDNLLNTPDHVLATMVIQNLDSYGEAVATTKRLALNIFNEAADTIILPGEVIQRGVEVEDAAITQLGSVDAIMTDPKKFNP